MAPLRWDSPPAMSLVGRRNTLPTRGRSLRPVVTTGTSRSRLAPAHVTHCPPAPASPRACSLLLRGFLPRTTTGALMASPRPRPSHSRQKPRLGWWLRSSARVSVWCLVQTPKPNQTKQNSWPTGLLANTRSTLLAKTKQTKQTRQQLANSWNQAICRLRQEDR